MTDEKKIYNAKKVYDGLCAAIERRGWKYDKEEEKLLVSFAVKGDDLPMQFIIIVDVSRQMVRLMSPLPFNMSEDKRMEGAIATCVASYKMADGSFDYDISDGQIVFRQTASFLDSEIGDGLFQYMISCASAMVDRYNDEFFLINSGLMSISDFIEKT